MSHYGFFLVIEKKNPRRQERKRVINLDIKAELKLVPAIKKANFPLLPPVHAYLGYLFLF